VVRVIGQIVATKKSNKQPVDPYNKGIELLARREHSARELKSKLARRGIEKSEVDAVLSTLQSKDFQNDARFGEMLVRTRIESGYGPRWIIAELKTHGIAESKAHELIDAAEPDWLTIVRNQLRRRYGKAAANLPERVKRANFLLRRGFDAATVQSATRAEGLESADELD
jgi:regulatory protein